MRASRAISWANQIFSNQSHFHLFVVKKKFVHDEVLDKVLETLYKDKCVLELFLHCCISVVTIKNLKPFILHLLTNSPFNKNIIYIIHIQNVS